MHGMRVLIVPICNDVSYFYDYAFENVALLVQKWTHYPYKKYVNKEILDRDTIVVHLYRSGFMPNYKHWYLHGET